MAPTTPIRARRTQAIVRAMRRRVRDRYLELLGESEMNDRGENIHPTLGVVDWQEAIYDTTMQIERAIYTGDEDYGDIEPELHAIFSP